MHEYKRQLLNALKIIAYIHTLRCDPHADIEPTTFLFGGKAAPGYYMAKDIIRLIWSIGDEIEHDPRLRDRIRVVYLEDYNVSTAEILMPASDISEQISLAGKEASGTGCMKFMINGALTLGTMDGANVEMAEAVGSENIYIFGLRAQEVDSLWKEGYSSLRYYQRSDRLRAVIDMLGRGFAGNSFEPIVNYLLYAHGVSDPYMCLADFDSYFAANECMRAAHQDPVSWSRKALINIAHAGHFSSDRCIREYADAIWHIRPIQ
jgi:starch phosphorylase